MHHLRTYWHFRTVVCFAVSLLFLSACVAQRSFDGERSIAHKVAELPERYSIVPPAVSVHPDGTVIAVRSSENQIKVWDWRNHRVVATLNLPRGANDGQSSEPIKFSPRGDLLVSCHTRGSEDTPIVIWNTRSWAVEHRIADSIPSSGCNAVAFTPDGQYMIRVLQRPQSRPGPTLIIYRTSDWQQTSALNTIPFFAHLVAVSSNGTLLALGGSIARRTPGSEDDMSSANSFLQLGQHGESYITILDLRTLNLVKSIRTMHSIGLFSSIAWTADGNTVAHAAGHGLQALDMASGDEVFKSTPTTGIATGAIHFTSDGRFLLEAQGRKGNGLRIWDAARKRLYQSIAGEFSTVAASADGRIMAATTTGRTIVWRLDP